MDASLPALSRPPIWNFVAEVLWTREFERRGKPMEIKHCCTSCFTVIAVHQHASWEEIKECQAALGELCAECRSWPGCPLPVDGTRGQEEVE
jgi:hypothetical protein